MSAERLAIWPRLAGIVGLVAVLGDAGAAFAETAHEEIIVTARKREEPVFLVPAAINVFSGESLQAAQIKDISDLQVLAPSLYINTTIDPGAGTVIRMRGVGTTGNNFGLEGSVGIFIDGVYRNRSGLGLGDLFDIDRVEVLRGPQSTIFGKNTSAGAISIITKKPTNEFESFLEVTGGNLSARKVNAWTNIPIVSDVLAVRISGGYFARDGFVTELSRDETINDKDRYYFRGEALYTPRPGTELRIIADYSHAEEHVGAGIRVFNGPTQPAISFLSAMAGRPFIDPPRPSDRVTVLDGALGEYQHDDWGLSAELNVDLSDNVKLTNILAWRDFRSFGIGDVDYTGVDIITQIQTIKDQVLTEEFRLSGTSTALPWIKSLDWLAGLYYTHEDIGVGYQLHNGTQTGAYFCLLVPAFCGAEAFFAPGTGSDGVYGTQARSYSAFGQLGVNITEKLSVTGGLRYGYDEKQGFGRIADTTASLAFFPGWLGSSGRYDAEIGHYAWSGSASIQYAFTPGLMTYASYAHGYKAGAINLDRAAAGIVNVDPVPIDPTVRSETVDSYEVGIKSKFWNDRASWSLTGFHARYDNFQILVFDGLAYSVRNVKGARTQGFELEGTVNPARGLTLRGGLTYAATRYDDGVTLPLRDATGTPITPADLGGKRLTNAPVWTASLGGLYEFPILSDRTKGFLGTDLFYGGARNTASELDPMERQKAYMLVNARAGVKLDEGRWTFSLWCKNCGDETYYTTVFKSVAQDGSFDSYIGDGREWGGTITAKF